jgi:hypothetical protein
MKSKKTPAEGGKNTKKRQLHIYKRCKCKGVMERGIMVKQWTDIADNAKNETSKPDPGLHQTAVLPDKHKRD